MYGDVLGRLMGGKKPGYAFAPFTNHFNTVIDSLRRVPRFQEPANVYTPAPQRFSEPANFWNQPIQPQNP
jgi:hypothetical protein